MKPTMQAKIPTMVPTTKVSISKGSGFASGVDHDDRKYYFANIPK
jgi:hypothetical protein